MADPVTFVLVGHCGPDSWLLKSAVSRAVPDAKIASADDSKSLAKHAWPGAVWLVNRELHSDFDADDGVALIGQTRKQPESPVMLLISNHADAQERAAAAGAAPGFGKAAVNSETTKSRLIDAAKQAREKVT